MSKHAPHLRRQDYPPGDPDVLFSAARSDGAGLGPALAADSKVGVSPTTDCSCAEPWPIRSPTTSRRRFQRGANHDLAKFFLFLDPKGYLLGWGHFEVIAFTRLDFGTYQDRLPATILVAPVKRCRGLHNPAAPATMVIWWLAQCSRASEARQRILKWQRRPTIWAFR